MEELVILRFQKALVSMEIFHIRVLIRYLDRKWNFMQKSPLLYMEVSVVLR